MRTSRIFAAGLLLLAGTAAGLSSAEAAGAPSGQYTGFYQCGQGRTQVTVDIPPQSNGASATFSFSAPRVNGSYTVSVTENGEFIDLTPIRWINRPAGYQLATVRAKLVGNRLDGRVLAAGCGDFHAAIGGLNQDAAQTTVTASDANTPVKKASSTDPLPKIAPAAYSETFTCRDGLPVPVDIYVLDQFERVFQFDQRLYQKVRVEVDGGTFVGNITRLGTGAIQIRASRWESYARSGAKYFVFEIDSYDNGLRGVTDLQGGERCTLAPRANSNIKSVESMSYPSREQAPTYDLAPLPPGFTAAAPPADSATYIGLAQDAILADADNWGVNGLHTKSLGQYRFYSDVSANPIVRLTYTYDGLMMGNLTGWAEVHFLNGAVDCVRFMDHPNCYRPRLSQATKIAALSQGKKALGPLNIASSCFHKETRQNPQVPVYKSRVVSAQGQIERYVDHYEDGGTYQVDVYSCEPVHFEIQCINSGSGAIFDMMSQPELIAGKDFTLAAGDTEFSYSKIVDLNRRISDKTCIRTK